MTLPAIPFSLKLSYHHHAVKKPTHADHETNTLSLDFPSTHLCRLVHFGGLRPMSSTRSPSLSLSELPTLLQNIWEGVIFHLKWYSKFPWCIPHIPTAVVSSIYYVRFVYRESKRANQCILATGPNSTNHGCRLLFVPCDRLYPSDSWRQRSCERRPPSSSRR